MRHPPALGDVAARSVTTGDVAGFDQAGDRFPHRRAGHSESLHQLALGRQLGARLPLRAGHFLQQLVAQPVGEQTLSGHCTSLRLGIQPTCPRQKPSPRGRGEPDPRWTEPRAAGRRRWRCRSCSPTRRLRSPRRPARCSRSIPRRSPGRSRPGPLHGSARACRRSGGDRPAGRGPQRGRARSAVPRRRRSRRSCRAGRWGGRRPGRGTGSSALRRAACPPCPRRGCHRAPSRTPPPPPIATTTARLPWWSTRPRASPRSRRRGRARPAHAAGRGLPRRP